MNFQIKRTLRVQTFLLLLGILGLSSAPALAFSLPLLRSSQATLFELPQFDSRAAEDTYLGIVSLGNCSGSLVRFVDSSPDDKALVLTNGHCVALLDPGEVRVNQKIPSKKFYLLGENGRTKKTMRSTRLLYATMTRTDLALYELELSYEELERDGFPSFVLSQSSPLEGTSIEIRSGYWRRTFRCAIEAIIPQLKEASWIMEESMRYTKEGCNLYGGTSGSPIIDQMSQEIVGVHNTGNESGEECRLNNPCEVDESGNISFEKDRNYGQQTSWVYTCRDQEGSLDLRLPGCLLPSPAEASPLNGQLNLDY